MIIFGFEEGDASYRFLGRWDHFFRYVGDSIKIGAAFRAREEIYTRSVTANYFACPDQIRVDTFRGCVCYLLNYSQVRAARCANGTRQFFYITCRRILIKWFTFRFIRDGRYDAFNGDLRCGLAAFGLVYVGAIRKLTMYIGSMINSVRSVVSEACSGRTWFILRPFKALFCDCPFCEGSNVAQAYFHVLCFGNSIRVVIVRFGHFCEQAFWDNLFTILGRMNVRVSNRTMV